LKGIICNFFHRPRQLLCGVSFS